MCEQLGQEPDPEKAPLTEADFPYEVQVAFFIYSLLSDRWDGTSGAYFGKDWAPVESFFKLYEVEEPKIILQFMKIIENIQVDHVNNKTAQKRKAAEQRAGKQYAHKVQG